jgi:HK97 gp10 family phage protein
MSKVQIQGMRELSRALRELPQRVATNDLQAATAAGARLIRDDARIKAPVYTGPVAQGHPAPGTLRKSIITKNIRELSDRVRRVVFVLVRHGKQFQKMGKKQINRDAFYWRFVEFGSKKMSARPFMRPAFEARKHDAVDAIKEVLAERIEQHRKDLSW